MQPTAIQRLLLWAIAPPLADFRDVDAAVAAARDAFDHGSWRHTTGPERAVYLRAIAAELRARESLLARTWTAEVGAPVAFSNAMIGYAANAFDYFAGLAGTSTFEENRPMDMGGEAHIHRDPVGVAVLITPWNASLPILANKLPAALAAGCTVVIKPSPETPFETLIVAACAKAAGLPDGVLNVVTAGREAGARLVANPGVDKISFTGSTAAGKQIAHTSIERMARLTLELGGKSAAIVLGDADLPLTIGRLAPHTMPFSGQICFAQTRLLVPRSRRDEVTEAYTSAMRGLTIGNPWMQTTQLGPLATSTHLKRVMGYIERGKTEGATLASGGRRLDREGFYLEPTVFTDVKPEMTIAREKIFGPVVSVMTYEDEDDAVRIANASDFGLSGTVFSRDPEHAYAVGRRMLTGNVGINGLTVAPNVPFGGYKQSGFGREGGPEGLASFQEVQV